MTLKMKFLRGAVCVLAALMVTAPATAFAADCEAPKAVASVQDPAAPLADTVWYYRTYNGKRQKRLWSIVEGRWLTDWIDC